MKGWVLWGVGVFWALELGLTTGWHFVPLAAPSTGLSNVLVEVRSSCVDRELLVADTASEPSARYDDSTGLWEMTTAYYETEGWAWPKVAHFLSLPHPSQL